MTINGERRELPAGLTIAALLQFLSVDAQRVAVELNREIVRKGEWEQVIVPGEAELEIVMFVGGGSQ